METRLATKADLQHLRDMLSRDLRALEDHFRLELAAQSQSLTIRLGSLLAAGIALLGALIKLT